MPDFLSLESPAAEASQRQEERRRPVKRARQSVESDATAAAEPGGAIGATAEAETGSMTVDGTVPWGRVARFRAGKRRRGGMGRAALLWLHEEILQLCEMLEETPEEAGAAADVLRAVDTARERSLGGSSSLVVFGSRVYGLNLPWADWDVVVTGSDMPEGAALTTLGAALRRDRQFDKVEVIASARIPIVKCRHASTGIEVDISMNLSAGKSSMRSATLVRSFVRQVRERRLCADGSRPREKGRGGGGEVAVRSALPMVPARASGSG